MHTISMWSQNVCTWRGFGGGVCLWRCAGGVSAGGDVGEVGVGEEVVCHEVKYDKPTKLYIYTQTDTVLFHSIIVHLKIMVL